MKGTCVIQMNEPTAALLLDANACKAAI